MTRFSVGMTFKDLEGWLECFMVNKFPIESESAYKKDVTKSQLQTVQSVATYVFLAPICSTFHGWCLIHEKK